MNRIRLFCHLVRFHFQLAPWYMFPLLLFILLSVSIGIGFVGLSGDGISTGSYRSYDQIMPYIYFFILAAQLTWGMRWGRATVQNQAWTTGSYAFLFTRAINRSTLYWAKLTVFFIICLIPALPILGRTVLQPDIRIQLYQKSAEQQDKIALYQAAYPDLQVTIPKQNPKDQLVTLTGAAWDWFLLKLTQVLLISLGILWLSSLSWRWPKIWIVALALFFAGMFLPLLSLVALKKHGATAGLSDDEQFLIWTHSHPGTIGIFLLLLTAFVLWDSHHRFLRMPSYKTAML